MPLKFIPIYGMACMFQRKVQRGREEQTDRQRDWQADRQAGRQTECVLSPVLIIRWGMCMNRASSVTCCDWVTTLWDTRTVPMSWQPWRPWREVKSFEVSVYAPHTEPADMGIMGRFWPIGQLWVTVPIMYKTCFESTVGWVELVT